jgi:hypothetical protein
LSQFVKNLRGTNGGGDHDPEMLTEIYHAIREEPAPPFFLPSFMDNFKALYMKSTEQPVPGGEGGGSNFRLSENNAV